MCYANSQSSAGQAMYRSMQAAVMGRVGQSPYHVTTTSAPATQPVQRPQGI